MSIDGLEVAAWPIDGLDGLMLRAQPSLMRGKNLPSASWQAHTLWRNTSHLVPNDTICFARRVVPSSSEADRSFAFFTAPGGARWRPPPGSAIAQVMRRVKSIDDFEEAARTGEDVLYCSASLNNLGAAALTEVQPLSPYKRTVHGPASTLAWLSAGHAVSCAHYDQSHNVYVQVIGRKRFALWPPSAHDRLLIYPQLHSMQRQSSLCDPREELASMGTQVTLEEGDVLYIPPFWTHHVSHLSNLSISVSVWSTSAEEPPKMALQTRARPWVREWSPLENACASARFVRSLLLGLYSAMPDPQATAHASLAAILRSRYDALRRQSPDEHEGLLQSELEPHAACAPHSAVTNAARRDQAAVDALGDQAAVDALGEQAAVEDKVELTTEELDTHVSGGAKRLAEVIQAISVDSAVRQIVLADYLEELSKFVVGRQAVHAFLRCVLASLEAGPNL